MKKFDKVNNALMETTRDSFNYLRVERGGRDARDSNVGYHTVNVITNNTVSHYNTLNDIISEFKLEL